MNSTLIAKNVQGLNLDQIRRECQQLAKARAKISAGVAIIPVPFLDVLIDVGMLSQLLPEINARFGLEDKDSVQAREKKLTDKIMMVSSLIATRGLVNKTVRGFGTRIIGKQVAKYVPLGGQIVAGTIGYLIFKKITFEHIEECYKVAKTTQKAQHNPL